jgi:hypothetical protein
MASSSGPQAGLCAPPPPDYAAFLAEQLQRPNAALVQRHDWQGQHLWVKRAGRPHPAWRYHLLALLTRALGVPVLQPVPNPGGRTAIATEVQRLRALAAAGLRVPTVLAQQADGFVMRDLGEVGQVGTVGHADPCAATAPVQNLGRALEQAIPQGAPALLALWAQGWAALRRVHVAGQCLSQAFARNLVLCPDGQIGFIDFEDNPAAHLPLALCQLRDALCYLHSTAWMLAQAQAMPAGQAIWRDWQAGLDAPARAALEQACLRLRCLRLLPGSRRWGRDAQRLHWAWVLLAQSAPSRT